jgi:hypothetical protein
MRSAAVLLLGGCSLFTRLPHRAADGGVACNESYTTPIVDGSLAVAGAVLLAATTNHNHVAGFGIDTDHDAFGIAQVLYADALVDAIVPLALLATSSLIGVEKISSCKRAREEYAHGRYVDHDELEAAIEERGDIARVEAQRISDSGKPYYCTTSATLSDVCFCAHDEHECELRQQSYGDVGVATSTCQLSATATCALDETAK